MVSLPVTLRVEVAASEVLAVLVVQCSPPQQALVA